MYPRAGPSVAKAYIIPGYKIKIVQGRNQHTHLITGHQ